MDWHTKLFGRCRAAIVLPLLLLTASQATTFHQRLLATSDSALPAKPNIESLLWPSRFETASVSEQTEVRFVANANRYVATVRSDGFAVGSPDDQAPVGVRFAGATPRVAADLSLTAAVMHFISRSGSGTSASSLHRFGRVTFENAYPGIDLAYRTSQGDLEFDFLVHPGAPIEQIRLAAAPGTKFTYEPDGSLLAINGNARYRLHAPEAYQTHGSARTDVPVRMALDNDMVRFVVGDYDHTKLLTIDPLVATYSTFIGTTGADDNIVSLATDSSGNLYLAGETSFDLQFPNAMSFPTTPTSLRVPNPRAPQNDCQFGCGFVLKLDSNRNVIYGALIPDLEIGAIAVDASGAVYATGISSELPATPGAFADDIAGRVFVLKLSQDGSALEFTGKFQGTAATGIGLDASGNVYIAGSTDSPALPTTVGSLKPTYQSNGDIINEEGFLIKISSTGTQLLYGTFLGGINAERVFGLSVASNGIATVVGDTASSDFLGLDSASPGGTDAFLVQVAANGSSVVAARRFGGSADESAAAISRDGGNGWLVGGATESVDFPVTTGVLQPRLFGQRNGWIVRLDSQLNTVYSTYFGGSFFDGIRAVAADAEGNAYLGGVTFSADVLTTADGFQNVTAGALGDLLASAGSDFYIESRDAIREAYVAVLTADGQRLSYGSYLGGYLTNPRFFDPLTISNAIVLDANGTVYVAGATTAASFPLTDGGLRQSMGGIADAFLVALQPRSLFITSDFLLPGALIQQPYTASLQATGGTPPYRWSVVGMPLPDGLQLDEGGAISGRALNEQTEIAYQFTAKVTDATGSVAYKSLHIPLIYPGNPICANHVCKMSVLVGQSFTFAPRFPARSIAPYSLQLSGVLPPGISFDSTSGTIGGTPTVAGIYRFGSTVTDSIGKSASLTWEVAVGATSFPPPQTPPSPAPNPSPPARKRGGGGALDAWMLWLLTALFVVAKSRNMPKVR